MKPHLHGSFHKLGSGYALRARADDVAGRAVPQQMQTTMAGAAELQPPASCCEKVAAAQSRSRALQEVKEGMKFLRRQILNQGHQAMLGQGNIQPSQVPELLK